MSRSQYRFALSVLVSAMVVAALSTSPRAQESLPYSEALLWRLQHPGGQHGYLFGTYHSPDRRLLPFVDHLSSYIEDVDAMYLELNTPDATEAEYALMAQIDEPLSNRLDPALYRRVTDYLARLGVNPSQIQYLSISIIEYLIYAPDILDGLVLDWRLEDVALENGTPTRSLETVEERFATLAIVENLDPNDVIAAAFDFVENYPAVDEEMLEAYIAADVNQLMAYGWFGCGDPSDADWCDTIDAYADALDADFARRNRAMVSRIAADMEHESIFAAVGAAHLPDDGGMLDLLVESGFVVTPIQIPMQRYDLTIILIAVAAVGIAGFSLLRIVVVKRRSRSRPHFGH